MEKLVVRNFLNLQNIELDLTKINIVIGQQASGKSILAKLVYFFRHFFVNYRDSIITNQKKANFEKNIIEEFQEIFPYYSWNQQNFEIYYFFQKYQISLKTKLLKSSHREIILTYSDEIARIRTKLIKFCDRKKDQYLQNINKVYGALSAALSIEFRQTRIIEQTIFIPAGRSFFANIEENIFSLWSSNIYIDYFMKKFGSDYKAVQRIYNSRKKFNRNDPKKIEMMDSFINKIIEGKYIQEKDGDWIECQQNSRRTKIINASSGQQEVLPMAIILAVLPFEIKFSRHHFFFIEEPEAHLFPKSQKSVIDLISLVFNITDKKHRFFITTHSPYILTAFNNLIQAGNTQKAIQERGNVKNELQRLYKIVPENRILEIEDIGAYTLEDGELRSIMNRENNLIDTNIIDQLSDEVGEAFEKLIDLELA